ncbi:uncharacterized protein LOC107041826 [Diachasma alloeum]|uniref:uncharacterized protein LOC107041826 n=1 Tax=Diachasma alloeum TaxID=454923 RepID=UPI0007381B67|nr:uncharacterized protein LOC107041826 [Diachasma alloeum]
MPKNSKCVVPHCGHVQQKNKECIYAKFPREVERCKKWVQAVGVEDLTSLSIEKHNGIRYVCGCHFTPDQFCHPFRKKLKMTAVPSLFDPRVIPLADELLENFPILNVLKIPIEDHKSQACEVEASASHSTPAPEEPLDLEATEDTRIDFLSKDYSGSIGHATPHGRGIKRYRRSDEFFAIWNSGFRISSLKIVACLLELMFHLMRANQL